MKKMITMMLLVCSIGAEAQYNSLLTKTIIVKDSFKLGSIWYNSLAPATAFTNATYFNKFLNFTRANGNGHSVSLPFATTNELADTSLTLRALIAAGGGSGGTTYSAGYGINITSNVIKADTTGANGISTKFKLDTSFAHLRGKDPDSLYRDLNVTKIRKAKCAIRPTVSGNNITWSIIEDSEHARVFFTHCTTPNNSTLRVHLPFTIKRILGGVSANDESFVLHGVDAGPSIGTSYLDFQIATSNVTRFSISNLTSTTASTPPFCASATVSGTEITYTVNGPYANSELYYGGVLQASYCGTNNRYVRDVLSGLGYGQNKFELVNPATGSVVAPDSNDKIKLISPYRIELLPTQTVGGNLLADKIYSAFSNFWVEAEFEIF